MPANDNRDEVWDEPCSEEEDYQGECPVCGEIDYDGKSCLSCGYPFD